MSLVLQSLFDLARCRAGNFATLFAILSPLLLGLAGGAADLIVYNNQETKMQDAADAAVLAATREASLKNWSQQEAQSVARAYVESALGQEALSSSALFNVTTLIDPVTRKVNITVDMDQHHYFVLGYFRKSPQIRVKAAAKLSSETPVCMIALEGAAAKVVNIINEASFIADGCAAYSNSTDNNGLYVTSTASMKTAYTCSGGGFGAGISTFNPAPTVDCPPMADPLVDRPQPAVGKCDHNNFSVRKTSVTISPGVYCGGMLIDNMAVVTMKPGVYIINGGQLRSRNSGSLVGEGVTIFFTGADGRLMLDGTSTVDLAAPTSGPTAGLLLMQDRAMALTEFEISSRSAAHLLGTIYLPNGHLKLKAPGKVADQSAFTVVVARSLEVGAETKMYLNSNYSATPVPVPAGLGPSKSQITLVN
ncbi:MAG: pilus assembly protein TadG-related protein [Rhizobiaceae bacterium]